MAYSLVDLVVLDNKLIDIIYGQFVRTNNKKKKSKNEAREKKWNRRNERNAIYRENRDNVVLAVLVEDKISPRDYILHSRHAAAHIRTRVRVGQQSTLGRKLSQESRSPVSIAKILRAARPAE